MRKTYFLQEKEGPVLVLDRDDGFLYCLWQSSTAKHRGSTAKMYILRQEMFILRFVYGLCTVCLRFVYGLSAVCLLFVYGSWTRPRARNGYRVKKMFVVLPKNLSRKAVETLVEKG